MSPEDHALEADHAFANWAKGYAGQLSPQQAINAYVKFMADAIRAAVAEEREACAKLCEYSFTAKNYSRLTAARLIRARGSGP